MPSASDSLIDYLRTAAGAWRDDPRDDAELLARFVDNGDEVAFKSLVWRHGLMVWRTCKLVLGNSPDAEDVFQITFLTLTRKANRLRRESLAGWLHRVARQTALDADINTRRRRKLEHHLPVAMRSEEGKSGRAELHAAIDEELAKLPEKLRAPLVLRYLEEKTQDEVARILGCARSVTRNRLARGEAILRERLERRGLALGIGSIATLLGSSVDAKAMLAGLIASTARAAVAFRAGTLTGVTADASQKLLRASAVEGAVKKLCWMVLVCVGSLGLGRAGVVAWKMFGVGSDATNSAVAPISPTTPPVTPKPAAELQSKRVDCYGDPLPEGALVRIGTVRFRGFYDKTQNTIFLSPDGKTVVMPSGVGKPYVFDVTTGMHKLNSEMEKGVLSVDGKLLAVQQKDCVQLLDRVAGQPSRSSDPSTGKPTENALPGYFLPVCPPVVFAPDGKTLVLLSKQEWECSTGQSHLIFYDIATRKPTHTRTLEIEKQDRGLTTIAFAVFSRDARYLACIDRRYPSVATNPTMNGAVHLLDVKR